eukprot:TRINITY_DN50422_c0_g1_i1.p1 TRINITY_DN50422_c0_g1~~TRINITY_DN50422_c0_g1_i1.p1  ORF type:complete len:375 (-),score=72.16 TRINITY_DN50422_c0_g1_i1:49-1089(-)
MQVLLDPAGLRNVALVWLCLIVADYAVSQEFFGRFFWTDTPRWSALPLTDAGVALFVAYQALVLLSGLSHLAASTADPGVITCEDIPYGVAAPRACTRCDGGWKPPRAHHCLVCGRCVFRMDHHCSWINNCVGLGNQKQFVLFLAYTVVASAITSALLACCVVRGLWRGLDPGPGRLMLGSLAFGAVACAVAVVFASEFLKEQFVGIRTNSTVVESYKGTRGPHVDDSDQLREVFGDWRWTWPLPLPAGAFSDLSEPIFCVEYRDPLRAEDYEYLGIAGSDDEDFYVEDAAGRSFDDSDVSAASPSPERGRKAVKRRGRNATPPPTPSRGRGASAGRGRAEVVEID